MGPSPETSKALIEAFAERGINFLPSRRVTALDPQRRVVVLDGGGELPYDLFLGVPRHRAVPVVEASGLTEAGSIPVDDLTLATKFPGVYAIGDCADSNMPRAGVFAEAGARAVASAIIASIKPERTAVPCAGKGVCYIEFGADRIGRVEVDFYSAPKPFGTFQAPSPALRDEKRHFGSSRRARWFKL